MVGHAGNSVLNVIAAFVVIGLTAFVGDSLMEGKQLFSFSAAVAPVVEKLPDGSNLIQGAKSDGVLLVVAVGLILIAVIATRPGKGGNGGRK